MHCICILEDDDSLRNTLAELFQANGFEVVERDNGNDVEELLGTNRIDTLLLDLSLKDEDGFEILKKIRNNISNASLPVIIVTADVTYERKIEGLSNGATDYIQKPFSINELLLKVNNFIDLKKSAKGQTIEGYLAPMKNINHRKDLFLRTVDAYLSKNIHQPINIDELALHCNMSRSSLDKIMRRMTHTTPALYIRKYKVSRAKQLLEQGHGSIKEIAYHCGFQSLSYFSTSFKLVTGESPTAYKQVS